MRKVERERGEKEERERERERELRLIHRQKTGEDNRYS